MADAEDSKSSGVTPVGVRPPPPAPFFIIYHVFLNPVQNYKDIMCCGNAVVARLYAINAGYISVFYL